MLAPSVLIGIDDTDNIDTRGTGYLARRLVEVLEEAGLGAGRGITRHQLLVDARIPYTSHNSGACICLDSGPEPRMPDIIAACSAVLGSESAAGSDPGLAVAAPEAKGKTSGGDEVIAFGRLAQREVLTQWQARAVAQTCGVHLSGHGGDEGGVIGALASVGLHLSGNDGWFLWMPGIRGLEGVLTYGELLAAAPIDVACDDAGREPAAHDRIELGDWVRPIWQEGQAVLLLENTIDHGWRVTPREVVKRH